MEAAYSVTTASLEKKVSEKNKSCLSSMLFLLLLFFFLLPSWALAASPRVICVPQLPTDLLVPHETWSGEPTTLKGVARDIDADLVGGSYYWAFGDGDESALTAITDPDNLSAVHTYTGVPGTLVVAHLYVTDTSGETSADEYRILIKEKTLDVEVNKGIDDGLWWIYTHREAADNPSYVTIPASRLMDPHGNPGLEGEYYNNTSFSGTPVLTRIDPIVDFDWGGGSPDASVNSNYFSVRWTGEIMITVSGIYKLATASDDGVRLYVDGNLLIDDWHGHGRTWRYAAPVVLNSGRHQVVFEYFENSGGANVGLYWSPPGERSYRWNNVRYGSHYGNTSASSVQAFEINGHLESGDADEDPYVDVVRGGLNYLMTTLTSYNMTAQTYGDPDANGNGIGLSINSDRPIYELGAVMDALVASGTPDAVARTGGANVLGRRYQDIVQDMVDMYAWGQGDSSNGGGWRYGWNSWPDNSASQWGAIGMIAAERHFGCTVPGWVKEQNDRWLTQSYNGTGFGYTGGGNGWSTTPSGMVQLSLDCKESSDSRWITAENYLANNWSGFISPTRSSRYYSYYAFAKAMRLALPQEVTHLSTGFDWYGDEVQGLARILVDRQLADGSWPYDGWPYVGERTAAAWNVIILTRTLFEKPPVALVHAAPNPGAVGQSIQFDASGSYHTDPAKEIVQYLWDFDASDGVDFEHPDATGVSAAWAFGELQDYTVSLKVIDNSTPERFDTTQYVMHVTIPPHPPTAVLGGPYLGAVDEAVQVDGSGSYDIDAGDGDAIIAWAWEADFVAPYDFNEASGETATLPPFAQAGRHDIALRVTDNTAVVFPSTGQPNLTDVAYGEVMVYNIGVNDLAARPKGTKCQLTWTHIGVSEYEILRSEKGPNEAFEGIGMTSSTYSTFIDYNVELSKDYWYRIRCELDGETVISAPTYVYSRGRIRNRPPVITSTPVTETQEAVLYEYQVEASDPEGTALTYILDQAPDGMSIGSHSGLVTWTPEFIQVGVHDVMVRVQDARRAAVTQFFQIVVTPRPNSAPVVNTGGPYSALTGESVTFAATATDPEGDAIVSWHWSFGDGTEADGQQVSHVYSAPGHYVVTVFVSDNRGATGSSEAECQVDTPNRAPIANAGGPYSGERGVAVAFDGSGSYDADGDVLTYTWNFGDSTPAATGMVATHVFAAVGTYTVSLTVDDGNGGIDTAQVTVEITPPNQPPVAEFTITGDLVKEAVLTFNASTSHDPDGDQITSWQWNFGDGVSTTGQIVTHAYSDSGDYTVSLTVTDEHGAPGTTNTAITVDLRTVTVPDVTGMTQADAESGLSAALLATGNVTTEHSTSVPAGSVIRQDPVAGTTVTEGTNVNIVLSSGQVMVAVPAVTGMVQADAETAVAAVGLTVGSTAETPSETVPAGQVISQDPEAGASVIAGSVVNLLISLGSQLDVVPNVVGMSQSAAENSITGAGFSVGDVTTQHHESIPAGSVISQNPEAGATPAPGFAVDLVLSSGPRPPEITLSMPPNLTIKNPYEIIGTIYGPTLSHYEIELAPQGSTNYRSVAAGDACVENGVLGVIDPTILTNGLYNLRFTIYDSTGNVYQAYAQEPIEISGKLKIGQFALAFNDITIPVAGIPITVTRTYNSFNKERGDFGIGWDLLLGSGIKIQVTRTLGENWYADYDYCFEDLYCPGGTCCAWVYKLETSNVPKVLVTYPDGRQDRFEFRPVFSTQPALDPEYATAAFTPLEGTTSTLEAVDADLWLVDGADGNTLYDYDFELYNPDLFRLTTAEGMVMILSRSEGLKSITDQNGNTLTLGPNAITHSSGLEIGIERDNERRITRISDPEGAAVQYSYDGNGDLAAFTDRVGNITRYGYDSEHNLTSIIDPRGVEILKPEYDESGRWIGSVDGLGNATHISHDMDNVTEYVTDGNGHTTAYQYDGDGNVIAVTGPLGNTTAWTYDAHGNKLSKTDALGKTTTWTYDDQNNKLSETDPLGHATTWTYNDRNQILTVTDPLGNVVSYTYDAAGNMLSMTDALGNVTTQAFDAAGNRTSKTDCEGHLWSYVYDAHGNMTSETDPLGHTTTWTHDARGNILTETDPLGYTTTREYDHLGNLVRTTDPLGNVAATEYNSSHKKSAEVDKNGNRTEYEYDANGNLVLTRYPDGTTEIITYDANNNIVASTDRAGQTILYEFSVTEYNDQQQAPQNQLVRLVHPDSTDIRYEYDATGRMIVTIDENSNRTETEYDAAGRKIRIIDALGNATTFAYDAAGNQTSMTDANGHATQFDYDALGRKIRTTFPDGTTMTTVYASSSNKAEKLSETDQAGNTNQYQYDALGRLLQVADALGNITSYSYDAAGNKSAQADANGNITSFTYDALQRLLTRTLPMGQNESFVYDANGNIVSKTDFNGDTISYEYDSMNRLVRKQYPDASEVSFTYTAGGKQDKLTDTRGVTSYTYALRNRLVAVTYPDGSGIEYTYDAKGNRLTLAVPSGTTRYSYDALGRLASVTDPTGDITTYTYDSVGNRASLTYPNGTVVTYTYDSLNRLISLTNKDSGGGVISSYTHTLGPAGNRLQVTEDTGRIVNYAYDSLYRLVQEVISDPILGSETINYAYDPVGNRLTKSDSSGTTNYTYNTNDQLVTEAESASTKAYTYDSNGNMVGKSDGVVTTNYVYDNDNRLVQNQDGGITTVYTYDVDGIRIASETGGVATFYLIDKNRTFAQVLEERDGSDNLLVDYVYGDDLISQNRNGTISYYHYDGQMSTRKLTDGSGNVSDSYIYDAFGGLLDQDGTTANSYLYTGEQYDPNVGFYYLRARYYDQNSGRFISHDPILGSQYEPLSLHRYLYGYANPLTFSDPSGLCCLDSQMSALGVLSTLVAMNVPTFVQAVAAASYIKLYDLAFELRYSGIHLLGSTDDSDNLLGRALMHRADRLLDFSERWQAASSEGLKIYQDLLLLQDGFNSLGRIVSTIPSLSAARTVCIKISTKSYESASHISKIAGKVGRVIASSGGQIRISTQVGHFAASLGRMTELLGQSVPFISGYLVNNSSFKNVMNRWLNN